MVFVKLLACFQKNRTSVALSNIGPAASCQCIWMAQASPFSILVFQLLSSLPQPPGNNSTVAPVSWRWSFFLVIPSASAISENLGFRTVGQIVKQQEWANRDRWLWMRECVSFHLPFGFCWCFTVAWAFEAVVVHWWSSSCSFAIKIGLWHLSCPHLQCRLPLQKLAACLHPRTWKRFGRWVDFLLGNQAAFFLTFSTSDCTGWSLPDYSFFWDNTAGLTFFCYSCAKAGNFSILYCAVGFCSMLRQNLIARFSLWIMVPAAPPGRSWTSLSWNGKPWECATAFCALSWFIQLFFPPSCYMLKGTPV